MKPKNEPINFGLQDIGSQILERFSDDLYSSESIIRELVKNASDSYYQMESYCDENELTYPDDYDSKNKKVSINITEDSLLLMDWGIGCDRDDIKKLLKIAISDKKDIPGTTGFRGIGFWAAFSAGERIIVETTKFNSKDLCILEVNAENIRKKINPSTDIGSIMNDEDNITLLVGETAPEKHYTTIEIQCVKSPGMLVSAKENRLYHFIHSSLDEQKNFIRKTCTLYLPEEHPRLYDIEQFYNENGIPLIEITLNDELMRKEIDPNVDDFKEKALPMEVADGTTLKLKEVAKCWFMRNKDKSGEVSSGMKGIRIYKDGYPVGMENMFSEDGYGVDSLPQEKLGYYAGEVHITFPELTADANGMNLTDGIYKRDFIKILREFYRDLIDQAYYRSALFSRRKKFISLREKIIEQKDKPEELYETIKTAEFLIINYKGNIKGKKGNVGNTNNRNLDRQSEVKEAARKLEKMVSEYSSKVKKPKILKEESKKKKNKVETNNTTILKTDTGGKEDFHESAAIKSKLLELLINRLTGLVDKDELHELIKAIEELFEGNCD
jgi:hypothetical protein